MLWFDLGQFSPWQSQKSCTGVWFVIEATHRLVLVWRDEGEDRESVINVLGRCAVKEILLDCSGRSKPIGGHLHELKKLSITVQEKSQSSLLLAATLFRCPVHMCGGFKTYTVYPLSQSAHGQHPLMKCLCYCDSSRPCCVDWIITPDWSLLRFWDRKHSGAIDCCACTPLRVCVPHANTHTC